MLKDDIKSGGSDQLEFKEKISDSSDKWLKTVVAFANCRGGRILFGVSDSREIIGLDCDLFAAKDAIADAIANACQPAIPMTIGISSVDGKPIIVLEIAEGRKTPYFLKAKGQSEGVYVRYDATTRQADELSIKDLLVNGSGRGFDQFECRGLKVTDADIDELCSRMFATARANAGSDEQRNLVKPVTKSQLVKWRILIPDGSSVRASNAYALLSGSDLFPVETKCAVFKGRTRDVFIDRRKFTGPVQEQVESAFEYVLSKINVGSKIEGLYREDVFEIPPSVIRELVVNAIVHRNYVDGESSSVSIALYDDRLEVTSPGRLPYGVTVQKMLCGYSECRNKALAQAFAYMNLIEDWGSGIPRITARVQAAGLRDIEFQAWPTAFRATVYRPTPQSFANESGINGKKGDVAESSQTTSQTTSQRSSQTTSQTHVCSSIDETILRLVSENGSVSTEQMAKHIGVSRRSIATHIRSLVLSGRLVRDGGRSRGIWKIP